MKTKREFVNRVNKIILFPLGLIFFISSMKCFMNHDRVGGIFLATMLFLIICYALVLHHGLKANALPRGKGFPPHDAAVTPEGFYTKVSNADSLFFTQVIIFLTVLLDITLVFYSWHFKTEGWIIAIGKGVRWFIPILILVILPEMISDLFKQKETGTPLEDLKKIYKIDLNNVVTIFYYFRSLYLCVAILNLIPEFRLFMSLPFTFFIETMLSGLIFFIVLKRERMDSETCLVFILWTVFVMSLHFFMIAQKFLYHIDIAKENLEHASLIFLCLFFLAGPYVDKKRGMLPSNASARAMYAGGYCLINFLFFLGLLMTFPFVCIIPFVVLFYFDMKYFIKPKPEDTILHGHMKNFLNKHFKDRFKIKKDIF